MRQMNKCLTCGYEAEQGNECVSCHVSRLEREGNEIAEQFDLDAEERYSPVSSASDDPDNDAPSGARAE